MNLTVFERLVLLSVLPKEGDFITLKLMRKLREGLSFNEKEINDIDFKFLWRCPKCQKAEVTAQTLKCEDCGIYMAPAGQATWDEGKAALVVKDVHIGDKMRALCESTLKRLSDEKKLTEQHMSLYEKFVEQTEGEI